MNALPSTVHPRDSALFRGGSENGGDSPTISRAWLMFQVKVVMVWFCGSTTESSRMYTECATLAGNSRSAQRGILLVLVRSLRERSFRSGVTSRCTMSSVNTCLLRGPEREGSNL